jgi:hypothetical protein
MIPVDLVVDHHEAIHEERGAVIRLAFDRGARRWKRRNQAGREEEDGR